MRVAVVGATGVIGRAVVPALVAAGHDVVGLARGPEKARLVEGMGAHASRTSLHDPEGLAGMFAGADAVCNLSGHVPVGLAAALPGAWRAQDRLRTEGVRRVVDAARAASVRRVVQESVSLLYADRGDDEVTEDSPLGITAATEPASVGESCVQDYSCGSRTGVVLRFGTIVGDDPLTRRQLRAAAHGRAVGLGSPDGWTHLVHTDDLGSAVLAALAVPSGVYNAGAQPVRRAALVAALSEVTGREVRFAGSLAQRAGGARLEPLTRSLRVSSERLAGVGGWVLRRPVFDASWFTGAVPRQAVR